LLKIDRGCTLSKKAITRKEAHPNEVAGSDSREESKGK
jgi:hypothetical protein